jgi:hypothetical protein
VQVQVVESVLGDVSDTKSRMLLDLSLLGQGLSLSASKHAFSIPLPDWQHECGFGLTVNNLIKVDFPAPLGPKIPTRLLNDSAQDTSIKLGLAAPS